MLTLPCVHFHVLVLLRPLEDLLDQALELDLDLDGDLLWDLDLDTDLTLLLSLEAEHDLYPECDLDLPTPELPLLCTSHCKPNRYF